MVQFKLQHRGLVRKVTFKNVDQPSWHELSWKIGDVCNIPHAAVALTYLDPDGDKITISSQAELKEYYSSLDEEELESNVPHKFIVRNLNEGVPDDGASDPREDNFLMRDAQTMAASTVGGGSQWGFNPEDEAERDPTKLRLSGYSTFADALGPLAGSTVGTEDDTETENDELPGGFKSAPSAPSAQPAKSSGWGLPMFGVWGSSKNTGDAQPSTSPPADPAPKQQPATNPWDNDQNVTKTPAWAAATTPTSTKAPPTPWAPPSSVATGALKGGLGRGGAPPPATSAPTNLASSTSSAAHPSGIVPAPVAPIVQMDSMVADRASAYAASPAFTATLPKSKKKKKMTQAERAKEEAAAKRAAEAAKIEEMELKAMEREAQREREENARISAEAAARAAVDEQRRVEEREWERERLRLKDEEERRKRQPEQPTYHPTHQHKPSDMSYSDEWQHVNNQSPDQEDEEAYRARIEAARANVFGTSPSAAQPPPSARQRKSSTKSKGERSTGKSSRPTSKVYPPTPAPQKHTDSGLGTDDGHSPWNIPTVSGFPPAGPANPTTAQVCSDVADLLVSFGRILDNERDLLDAIRETFSHNLGPGALNATFGNRNLSPEMLRIVASVDDLLTKILPSRPPASHASANMELEPRIPTPSVTPTPVIPAEPEFNVPKTEYGNSFEFANRGRQSVPVINVPRPKYPVSPLTRDGYSTGTTPPAQPPHGYAASPFLSASPDKSSRARSRSRPPPGDFEIVPPSHLPPQARVVPPPVVPDDETDGSPMTPDASRGFARQSTHEGGLVLANQTQRSTDVAKADMEAARQHYKSQRELYKLEKAERKKEMEERAAAKAERKRAKAAMNNDPNITDLTNQLQNLVPPRPYEAERRYIESPYDNAPRTAGPYPGSTPGNTVYAEGLGQVTLVPPPGSYSAHAAVTAPVSPVHEESPAPSFERARRRRQSLNGGSPERYSHSRPPPSTSSRTETYHGLQPDAFPGAAHHSQYAQGQAPQQDLAKRVALRLTEMGYTPQKYPALPAILGHRIRPLTNTPGVSENELAYHIIQDLFKYGGHN